MKVEITTLELADLLNTVQGRHKVAQNPLGMSADELIEKTADRVIQRIQETLEASQEEQEDDRDDIPALISTTVNESFAKLEENLVDFVKLLEHLASPPTTDAEAGHLAEAGKMVEHTEDGRAADEAPDYPNEIVGKKEEPAALEDGAPKEAVAMPVWDESAGIYVVNGNGHVGRDLWNKDNYRGWFNEEIRRLRKDGKSPQYIADRIKVTAQAVKNRMRNYKID